MRVSRLRGIVGCNGERVSYGVGPGVFGSGKTPTSIMNPEKYKDHLVRVSGFSARFTSMGKPWQDALIEPTRNGL